MILHNEIMNISARPDPDGTAIYKIAYKQGHRDARHAAAEMSLGLEDQRDKLREALDRIRDAFDDDSEVGIDTEQDYAIQQARAALKATEEG